jgi:competence protein ComEC
MPLVSGMNVAYCTAIFLFCFRLTGLRRRQAALCTIPFIVLYVFVTAATPPVVRAGVMALFVILSLSLAREPLIYQSLSLAALVILLFDPQALFTVSFQLSFAATIAMVYLYPSLMAALRFLPYLLRNSLGATAAVSFAAQAGVIPLIACYFNRVSLVGLVSNIFIVPLTGLITILGIVLYAVHFVSPFLTHGVAYCTYLLLHLLLALVRYFASVPWATTPVATPSVLTIIAYYLLLLGLPAFAKSRKIGSFFVAAALLLVSLQLLTIARHGDEVRVTFLDVGDSDAIHIRFPGNHQWLIDAGGTYRSSFDPGEKIVCPYLRSKGIRYIDRIVITHPHLPHYGGLKAVIANFPVGEIAVNSEAANAPGFGEIIDLLHKKNIVVKVLRAGDRFVIANSTVSVLSPARRFEEQDDNCLVLSLEAYRQRFLLTADMGVAAEERLLSSGVQLAATVVQWPNHGQRPLSSAFLRRSSPSYVLLSAGKKTPAAIDGYSGRVCSTAERGAVTFIISRRGISCNYIDGR